MQAAINAELRQRLKRKKTGELWWTENCKNFCVREHINKVWINDNYAEDEKVWVADTGLWVKEEHRRRESGLANVKKIFFFFFD